MKSAPSAEVLRGVGALILDCDGVLTGGELIYDQNKVRSLVFDAKDGAGLAALCRISGVPVGVLSGRPIDIAEHRLAEIGIRRFVGSCRDKAQGVLDMLAGFEVEPQACAFMGDDIADLFAFAH